MKRLRWVYWAKQGIIKLSSTNIMRILRPLENPTVATIDNGATLTMWREVGYVEVVGEFVSSKVAMEILRQREKAMYNSVKRMKKKRIEDVETRLDNDADFKKNVEILMWGDSV